LIVDAGATLTVDEGDYIRVNHNIGVRGTLQVNKTANVVQVNSNGVTTKEVGGIIRVEVETPVLENRHFVVMGSPMTAEQRTGVFKDAFLVLDFHPENFIPHPDVPAGGTNFADDNGDYYQMYDHGRILKGEGYVVRPQTGYTDPAGIPYSMTFQLGTLNTGNITYRAENRGTTLNPNGTPNVVANPYPSAISADLFMDANPTIDALYYWEHLTAPGTGLAVSNLRFDMDDISIYNGSMGLPAANDPGNVLDTAPNNVIPTAQGFGVRTTGTAGLQTNVVFNNFMRLTSGNTILREQESTPSTLLLELREENYKIGGFAGIAFSDQGTAGLDHQMDTRRLGTVASLFSHLEDGTEQLGIQTRESFNIDQEIKLGFASQLDEESNYTISLSSIEGSDLTGTTVWLEDNQTGAITNLREASYTFMSNGGMFEDRFLLRFEENSLGTSSNLVSEVRIFPNPTNGILNITSTQDKIESVTVYDMMGRVVIATTFANSSTGQLDISNLKNAIYFAEIKTNSGTISKKIIKN
ncbi:MAG: T9SS type A sorting domain-containing protein, partial [Flavobacteriaceae bacterium]|nr:T9SS type A sorting domain-containing protein [Flavobacteriaceae bacterium]